jgi:predicted dehydrogenase
VLKAGGGALAALMAGGVPCVHAGEDNTIRLAMIGCGSRGRGALGDALAEAIGPVKLYAMADLSEPRLSSGYQILQQHFGARVDVAPQRRFVGFEAYRQAIDCLRPGDVAMLTAYAYCRPAQLEYAVKKGVNVFMEKSFAADPAGCRRIVAAGAEASKRNLKIAAGLQCRHSVARQALINKIRAGELGEIQLVRATRNCGRNFLARPPHGTDLVDWQIRQRGHFLWASAGILSELLIHQIDECCWVKDSWPVSARGTGTFPQRAGNCSQNVDDYWIEYTYADGGKAEVVGVSPFATFVRGSKRAAQFSGDIHAATVHTYKGHEMTKDQIDWAAAAEPRSPWQAEWKNLFEAIRNDRVHNEAQRASHANLAVIMGRAAVHMGRPVTWDEVQRSTFAFSSLVDRLKFGGPAPVEPDADGKWPVPAAGKWVEV